MCPNSKYKSKIKFGIFVYFGKLIGIVFYAKFIFVILSVYYINEKRFQLIYNRRVIIIIIMTYVYYKIYLFISYTSFYN